mmetsp:Transcript_140529/g.365619  ORF Transcript_140529/g.365619 Transcript_140529/m.365619 type:complete len:1956 (-) Transcript_140529:48-5915(-)
MPPVVAPRPVSPAAAMAAKNAAVDKPVLRVSTQSKNDEIGIQTLVGDYLEKGTNHGKKFYQKTQKIAGHEDIDVFLYYWDARDGADFSGWWFGDQVGGSQVWARSTTHGAAPPRVGWKVPWDAPTAEPGLLFVDPAGVGTSAPAAVMPPAASAQANLSPAALQARVKEATAKVEAIEATCQEALGASKGLSMASGEEDLKESHQNLLKQQTSLVEVQKSLTQDITEARKGGAPATSSVTDLSKLSPRLRVLQTGLTTEVARVKGFLAKVQTGAANAKKQAELQAAEEKDSKELQETLPATKELVSSAEDSVEAVVMMAAPLIADPPDDEGDGLKKALEEVETAAADAQGKITEARSQINAKLQAARKFAPETRKTALTEFSGMQQKLTEAQKRLNPYKSFQKEFKARVQARKSLTEFSEQIAANELEVEKVTMMSSAADQGQMSEDEISSAEKVMQPAKMGIDSMLRTLETKMRTADGAMKDELMQMKDKASAVKRNLEGVATVLRKQRESYMTAEMLKQASDKVDTAEETLSKCQEAEMPFLKGLEVLPGEESNKALADCEAAASKADAVFNQTRAFLRTKLVEAKKFVPELSASMAEELKAHQSRLDSASEKLASFKKETLERKMAALMAEVIDGLSAGEKKIELLVKVAEIFSSDSLETVSTADLKDALEKTAAAEKEASAAMLEVRKVFAAKQKEAKAADAQAALTKMQSRINAAQQELAKTRKAAASGEKLIKGKEVLAEEEEKIKHIETEVAAWGKKVQPGEEEAALGIEAAQPSDEDIEAMTLAFTTGKKTLAASLRLVEGQLVGAPTSLKASLQKLIDRSKATLAKISELMVLTKDQRELVMSQAYVREAKAKMEDVDKAMEQVNDAELPFLKGIEVLDLKQATSTIAESEAAAAAVQAAIAMVRNFIASKNLEIKPFGEEASKPAKEEFAQLTERINAAAAKLGQFKKDTDGRKKTALMQEAAEKMSSAEAAVKELAEVVEPLTKEEGDMDIPEDECEKLVARLKNTQTIVTDTSNFIVARQKEVIGNAAHTDSIQDLQSRLKEAKAELVKHQKVASKHEQKYVAKKLLAEANETLAGMDAEVKKATDACAPLLEEGGLRFLVAASVRTLAAAWRDYMKDKGFSHEALHRDISGGADGITQDKFVEYLAKLPEALSREEIAFSEERRVAIFKNIDADGDGLISPSEFKEVFMQKFLCIKEITVTDVFEVAKSKTTAKIGSGSLLETYHGAQKDESNGMMRIECSDVATGKTGFVTIQSSQGTKFIELISPFSTFCKEMESAIDETIKCVAKVAGFITAKTKELVSAGKDGPLADARTELTKLRSRVSAAQEVLRKLRVDTANGKKEFAKKELAEKNAHIEARERKEAEIITGPASAKVEAMDVAAKALEEAAQSLVSISGEDLEAFATPIAVIERTEQLLEVAMKCIEEVKVSVAEQQDKLPKVVKGPMLEAKRELQKMLNQSELVKKQSAGVMDSVRGKCQRIVDARSAEVSGKLRGELQSKSLSVDRLFCEIASPGEERISEAAFCKYIEGLQGEAYKSEQIILLCRHIESGGIGRRRFQAFLQQYFAVVKGIALTDDFDISQAKTIRKAELEEVLELLEGPRTDEKVGVTRIKGKSLKDGAEGWISMKGNQGTPFLQEVEKPFYCCQIDIALEQDFKINGDDGLLRTLKVDEVLELIEGPRKLTFEPSLRVRGKTTDGSMGWFTARDRRGIVFAEADGKYYSCTSSVAMTDNMDIKDCKVIRKLGVGELFTVEEGPVEEKDAGITRVKGKSVKDEKVGWITIKGNAGTVYAEPSTKHYCILEDTPLSKKFASSSGGDDEIRVLAKGEAMHILEGPKEETFPPETRIKVKTLSDGGVGWITMKSDNVKPWTPYYKCTVIAPLHDQALVEGATAVRDIEVGEALELLEGPTLEGSELRMKARAEKDGVVGWVTIKDGEGRRLFES